MSFRFGEAIVITRPPERNRFGDQPGQPTENTVTGVGFAFSSTNTKWPLVGEDLAENEALLFLPEGTDIRKGDTVTRGVDGSQWHVVGRQQWNGSKHPMTGWSSGMFTQKVREVS
ncbi:hypothetical protein ACXYTP_23415 [Tsukamurella ocularis]